jgi:hypothetical protein
VKKGDFDDFSAPLGVAHKRFRETGGWADDRADDRKSEIFFIANKKAQGQAFA